jgi:hypothetical protein
MARASDALVTRQGNRHRVWSQHRLVRVDAKNKNKKHRKHKKPH